MTGQVIRAPSYGGLEVLPRCRIRSPWRDAIRVVGQPPTALERPARSYGPLFRDRLEPRVTCRLGTGLPPMQSVATVLSKNG